MIYRRFARPALFVVAFFAQLGCTGLEAVGTEPITHVRQDQVSIGYRVISRGDLRGAHVRVCVSGFRPTTLEPISSDGAANLVAKDAGASRPTVLFPPESSCVSYEVTFRNAPYVAPNGRFALLSQTDWLWRPVPMTPHLEARVKFEMPTEMDVSMPWPRENGNVFRLSESAFSLASYNVVGSFQSITHRVEGVDIEIVDLGSSLSSSSLKAWLGDAVRMVAYVGDRFPVEHLQVIVASSGPGVDPVAFGMVRRGGGISVLLLPHDNASATSLRRDWVLVHELSHLWLPRLEVGGRWLSEGIATYLQEVLRANCGAHTPETAWRRIRAGFRRGRRIRSSRTLAAESEQMSLTGNYYRVYWAGVAFALEADLRLRRETGGKTTLINVLAKGRAHWRGSKVQSVDAMLRTMDEVAGTSFLRVLGQDYARQRTFPDTSWTLARATRQVRARITLPDTKCTAALRGITSPD